MKTKTHADVAADVSAFLASGGKVTECKTSRRKVRMEAKGKQKLSFGWAAPKNRPCVMWDNIETKI